MNRKHLWPTIATALCAVALFSASSWAQGGQPKSAAAAKDQPASASKGAAKGSRAKTTDLVDINSATKEQLDALPGIGEAYAGKIIAGRPYKMKTQLVSRNVLPKAVYEKIADKIIAKQPPKGAASAKGAGK